MFLGVICSLWPLQEPMVPFIPSEKKRDLLQSNKIFFATVTVLSKERTPVSDVLSRWELDDRPIDRSRWIATDRLTCRETGQRSPDGDVR